MVSVPTLLLRLSVRLLVRPSCISSDFHDISRILKHYPKQIVSFQDQDRFFWQSHDLLTLKLVITTPLSIFNRFSWNIHIIVIAIFRWSWFILSHDRPHNFRVIALDLFSDSILWGNSCGRNTFFCFHPIFITILGYCYYNMALTIFFLGHERTLFVRVTILDLPNNLNQVVTLLFQCWAEFRRPFWDCYHSFTSCYNQTFLSLDWKVRGIKRCTLRPSVRLFVRS